MHVSVKKSQPARSVKSAIDIGFKKALSAILDGNITTLIAAIVLGIMGTGSVKGFAYTLAMSIILSMFSALVISRYLAKAFYALGFQDVKYYGCPKKHNTIDFLKHKKVFFAIRDRMHDLRSGCHADPQPGQWKSTELQP